MKVFFDEFLKKLPRGVLRTQSNIYDGSFCENSQRHKVFTVFNYLKKKAPSWMFDWALNAPLLD